MSSAIPTALINFEITSGTIWKTLRTSAPATTKFFSPRWKKEQERLEIRFRVKLFKTQESYLCSTPVAGWEVRTMLNMLSPILTLFSQNSSDLLSLFTSFQPQALWGSTSEWIHGLKTDLVSLSNFLWKRSWSAAHSRWQHWQHPEKNLALSCSNFIK